MTAQSNTPDDGLLVELKLWAASPRVPEKVQLLILEAIGRLSAPSEKREPGNPHGFEGNETYVPQFDKKDCQDELRARVKALEANEAAVLEYVKVYEWLGEDESGREGYYSPTAKERAMIADAIAGLHADDDFVRTWDAWRALCAAPSSIREPLKMLMFCPRCSKQHIDRADEDHGWTNPPHATHTCQHCGLLWRPSNENTTGVPFIVAEEEKHRERIAAAVPSARVEPLICYTPCKAHEGMPWTMTLNSGYHQPAITKCPICEPPK